MRKEVLIILFVLFLASINATISAPSCTQEDIRATWGSIFEISYTSTTIVTIGDTTEGRCNQYIAYKTDGDYLYLLLGEENKTRLNSSSIKAIKLIPESNFLGNVTSITQWEQISQIDFDTIENISELRPSSLNTLQVDSTFSSIFKESPKPWYQSNTPVEADTLYMYKKEEINESKNTTITGRITINHSYSSIEYEIKRMLPTNDCETDWNCSDWAPCVNGTKIRSCIDLQGCGILDEMPNETEKCDPNCETNFTCTEWTDCANNKKTRNCTDENGCMPNKVETTNCGTTCAPKWNCTNWGTCIGNTQVRNCVDINSCGVNTEKPTESQSCRTICTPEWNCTNWSPNICPRNTKTQSRTCTDLNNCGTIQNKPDESKSCSNAFNWLFWLIVAIIIILIGGTTWMLVMKHKENKKHIPTVEEQYGYKIKN